MASPQTENGYTRIANEIMEALFKAGLSGNQYAVTLLIIRESYGWNKKVTRPMGLKTMAGRTGIARSSIQLALRKLCVAGIVHSDKSRGWCFNKDYEKWVGASPLALGGQPTGPKGASPLALGGQPTVNLHANLPSKSRSPKDIRTKTLKTTTAPSAIDLSRIQFPYGKRKGFPISSLPVDECQFFLKDARLGADIRAALKARIDWKREEMTPAQIKNASAEGRA